MNISEKLQTSWALMKSSLRVIRDQPRLALFPVVSAVCTVLLALFFFAPLIMLALGTAGVESVLHGGSWAGHRTGELKQVFGWVFYSYGAVVYLVSLFAATFFNVAFYNEILRALAGDTVSLGGGLRFAASRLRSIVCWSLLAGTVGLIIRAIEERLGWLGKIGMALVGTAWSVAAVFAIPVIIRRGETNPFAVLKDSALTLKQTWGESLVGFVGIQMAGGLVALGAILSGAAIALVAIMLKSAAVAVILGALWLLAVWALAFLTTMATHVYRCALYVYASEGVVPGDFTVEMMDAGWKVKKA